MLVRHSSGDNYTSSEDRPSSVTDNTDSENLTNDIIPEAPEVPVEAVAGQVEIVLVNHCNV